MVHGSFPYADLGVVATVAGVSVYAQAQGVLPADVMSVLAVYGPMGLMLGWFMMRWEKITTKLTDSHDRLTKSILLSLLTRPDVDDAIRHQARRALTEMNGHEEDYRD